MSILSGAYLLRSGDYETSGLTAESKSLIENVVWNTATLDRTVKLYQSATALDWYIGERGTSTGKTCTSGNHCNDTVIRTTTWTGKVGLMYPSDYGYSTGGGSTYNKETCLAYKLYGWNDSDYKTDCAEKSWLYNGGNQWTITPLSSSTYANHAVYIDTSGYVGARLTTGASGGTVQINLVRPVVYLRSKVFIKNGDGTKENPYEFELRG